MWPTEIEHPGQGRTGAAKVNREFYLFYINQFSVQFQQVFHLFSPQLLITTDGRFEPELSPLMDSALGDLEAPC
jgi:hypothetical protein